MDLLVAQEGLKDSSDLYRAQGAVRQLRTIMNIPGEIDRFLTNLEEEEKHVLRRINYAS